MGNTIVSTIGIARQPAELTLEQRLRTAHVTRWQIVRVARQQTLAEHLYLVRTIVLEIARAAGLTGDETRLAEQWALEHDVPEVITGDLATPVKAAIRQAVPHDDPIRTIELSLSESYAGLYSRVKGTAVQDLVKMADLIEAVHFLTIEGMGPHAYSVKRRLWDTLLELVGKCQKRRPTYNWAAVYAVARKLTGA